MDITDKKIKRSRNLYIIEAALEYFIAILVSGSFLATITTRLGFSDAHTGILSSIISLGSVFQLISIAIRPKRSKPMVVALSIANQVLFTFLYVIPLPRESNMFLKMAFIGVILTAYLLYYIAHPKKTNWFMSLVDDKERGRFTANKEIVSLITGMGISFGMGAVVDYFKAKGDITAALIVCAITMFSLTVLHTLTILFTVEPETNSKASGNFLKSIVSLAKDKNVLKVSILFVIWAMANSVTAPFIATYNLKDLGLSVTTTIVIAAIGSVGRILVSRFWGAYADKNSFAKMDMLCFGVAAVSFLFIVFSSPKNGIYTMTGYNLLHAVALGGINSSLINLVFDLVPEERRADSLAVTQVASGVSAFLVTLAVSPFVDFVQSKGNKLFGISVYPQQITAAVSVILTLVAIIYTGKTLVKRKKA